MCNDIITVFMTERKDDSYFVETYYMHITISIVVGCRSVLITDNIANGKVNVM